MPYIKKEDRERAATTPTTVGELNFAITMRAVAYLEGHHRALPRLHDEVLALATSYIKRHHVSYTLFNSVIGALACAEEEMIRRLAWSRYPHVRQACDEIHRVRDRIYYEMTGLYEDQKIAENGDVYPERFLKTSRG